jgi:DNA gyrase subunit A
MISKNGSGIVFKESEARPMGRSASGVIGMRLRSGDEVISVNTFGEDLSESKAYDLITVLENGYGKRTNLVRHFPLQKRGGYGVRASKITPKTGKVIGALITNNIDQDLIIVSNQGQVIRIPLRSAKVLGRDTQGVRLMKINSNDKVASVSNVTTKIEEIEEKASDQPSAKNKGVEKSPPPEMKKGDNGELNVHYWKNNGK